MCGIFGAIQRSPITASHKEIFEKSLEVLKHRGPDSTGVFCDDHVFLWHQRLAIIDTRSCANQPFVYDNYLIIFNGEIYNFKTLRAELIALWHTFTTESDTEVILHAYQQRGENCTKKFDGMRALALYDQDAQTVFLSRDRIGEKPLIYFIDDEICIFWSEIPAILATLPPVAIKPNFPALANFDTYNFKHIPAPYTAFENIYKLKPWHSMTVNVKTLACIQYKHFAVEPMVIQADPVQQFIDIFSEAVEQTCYADVPVGVLLSWGIDSSLIAAMLQNRDITTYSLGYNESDPELIRAAAIAKHLWLKNKQIHFKDYISKNSLLELVKENITYLGEPINLFQIIYSDILLREMKKDGIIVVVWWNAADELFYGYDGMNSLLSANNLKKKVDRFHLMPWFLQNDALKSLLYKYYIGKKKYINKTYRKFLYEDAMKEYAHEITSTQLIDIFSWQGLRIDNEHSITMVADLSGAKNSMEIRAPFLNKKVIDFACSLPIEWKVTSTKDKTNNKYILKKALERFLPAELVYQKKMWFGYSINPLERIGEIPSTTAASQLEGLYEKDGQVTMSPTDVWEKFLINTWGSKFLG
jgi:asparagine synthase (glutamine-hydrolysing)